MNGYQEKKSKNLGRILTGSQPGRKLVLFIGLLSVSVGISFSQKTDSLAFRMVFYNTENFFDTFDDTLTDDEEFLPGGIRGWNYPRYEKKVNSIYRVLAAAGEWTPPVIAGLCEIENRKVLSDLAMKTWLSRYRYGIVHRESDDPRGIDVGVIFRTDQASLLHEELLIPSALEHADFKTRGVLYSVFCLAQDTIHLFLNHWPSRRGGVLMREDTRKMLAIMVKSFTDSIISLTGGTAKIIIAGDFNCTPDDEEMILLTGRNAGEMTNRVLINLSEQASRKGSGTFKFDGVWEMLDQVIVSPGLMSSNSGLYVTGESFRVINASFLLRKDLSYPGLTTFSTYLGYRYSGGFSDHLPVVLDLFIRNHIP